MRALVAGQSNLRKGAQRHCSLRAVQERKASEQNQQRRLSPAPVPLASHFLPTCELRLATFECMQFERRALARHLRRSPRKSNVGQSRKSNGRPDSKVSQRLGDDICTAVSKFDSKLKPNERASDQRAKRSTGADRRLTWPRLQLAAGKLFAPIVVVVSDAS